MGALDHFADVDAFYIDDGVAFPLLILFLSREETKEGGQEALLIPLEIYSTYLLYFGG
ncbi:MAG: hypothetical protein VXZ72_03210 [Chlamydiota bacterium]|nr:hypothetical protein [Chlamydiota bacterium]